MPNSSASRHSIDLKNVDLNLLVVFHRLLQQRSVSGAAQTLELSQPAVSNALRRLRLLFDDELFVRTNQGMQPTALAMHLAEPVTQALNTIEKALSTPNNFLPAQSQRQFTLAMTDLGEIVLLPSLLKLLENEAPKTTLSTVRDTDNGLSEAMQAGQVDLAIGLLPQLTTGFFQQRLFTQRYVCLFKKGHEFDQTPPNRARYFAADHALVVSGGTGHTEINEIIDKGAQKRKIRLYVPHFVALGHILSTSNMVATVPEYYAIHCAKPFGLKYCALPFPLPRFNINMFWHARFHKEPDNQWLRQQIFKLFSEYSNSVNT